MQNRIISSALALLFLGTAEALAANPPCNMQGLSSNAPAYNDLACRGLDAYDAGNYVSAAQRFEAALAIHLFELPNFELLPWLASAYARSGNMMAADRALAEANGAVAILHGELVCVETDDGFHLAAKAGGNVASMSPGLQEALMLRMCGGAYEAIYSADQNIINEALGDFFSTVVTADREIRTLKVRQRDNDRR